MMDTGEVRKRLLQALDRARQDAARHRAEADAARAQLGPWLDEVVAPVFRQLSGALKAEGHAYQVFTPAGSVRLASERSADDFVELTLDTAASPVAVVVRMSVARGRRVEAGERVVHEGADVGAIGDEQVLAWLLEAIPPLIVR